MEACSMSEVIQKAQHEFWRPPVAQESGAAPAMVDACYNCGAEFMVGGRFCHLCGCKRQMQADHAQSTWVRFPQFVRSLEFQNVKQWFGLPTASLIAFLLGLGCLLGVLAVGLIYTAQNFNEFQAIQLWRVQWLL